jgi:hypothetical protein
MRKRETDEEARSSSDLAGAAVTVGGGGQTGAGDTLPTTTAKPGKTGKVDHQAGIPPKLY